MTDLLVVDNLAVQVQGIDVLANVGMRIPRGGSLGIVGETGSGKSVTCRALLGLLDRIDGRVVSGSAVFDGIELTTLNESGWSGLRGRRIGLVPQASLSGLDPLM